MNKDFSVIVLTIRPNKDFSVIVLTLRPYNLSCIFNQNQK